MELMKLTNKIDKILTNGMIINPGAKWMESFSILVSHFIPFLPRIEDDSGSVELGQGQNVLIHYNDAIMVAMASPITSLTIVYSTVYSGAYQRKYQSPASLAFVRGIHHGSVNSSHKWPVTRKMFPFVPFDDVIVNWLSQEWDRVTQLSLNLSMP